MLISIKALFISQFMKLRPKVKYTFYIILLLFGSSLWLRHAVIKGERKKAKARDTKKGLNMLEKVDEIDREVNLMREHDLDKWLRNNKEWLRE